MSEICKWCLQDKTRSIMTGASQPVHHHSCPDTLLRDRIDDLTKQLQEAKASSVPVDDIAQLIHDVLNQEFVSQHPSDVMGRELLRQALNAFSAPSEHRWDQAGERCVKCGAKDWMGGPCNASPAPMQNTMKILEDELEAALQDSEVDKDE